MVKFALGVHHLNVAYTAGDIPSYHRQVREGVLPLLDLLQRNSGWCFSIELCGSSIEFIADHYPFVLELIKSLINTGQIELISCTYSPQIWISFPLTDLLRSIEINQEVLKRYSLKASRIFFTQENFSGEGIKKLAKWFDCAIVKDDYYCYLHKDAPITTAPYLSLGDMKLLVGWGHIMEIVASNFERDSFNAENAPPTYESFIKHKFLRFFTSDILEKGKEKKRIGSCNGLEWTWFHIGSSERFSKPHMRSNDVGDCKCSPEWLLYIEGIMREIEREGYVFSSIEEFLGNASKIKFEVEPCLPLLDGAWNMESCKGGFLWSGYNRGIHEDDILVRNSNWRSRSKLMGVESLISRLPNTIPDKQKILEALNAAWKIQLLSEASDSTGWDPEAVEVAYGIYQSEDVLNAVANISTYIKANVDSGLIFVNTANGRLTKSSFPAEKSYMNVRDSEIVLTAEIYGGNGLVKYYKVDKNTYQIVINFFPLKGSSGVEFEFLNEDLVYSPALMDDETVSYPISAFSPDTICLPLPNGLVEVKKNVFLIKHNEYLNISCRIDRNLKKIIFGIENPKKRHYYWVFSVVHADVKKALDYANTINIFPIVCL